MGDLVEGDPQAEVPRREVEATFDLGDVRPDEVQEALVVGGQERVVLPEDATGDVAEERAGLGPERRAPDRAAARRLLRQDPTGERLEHPLEAAGVRPDPFAPPHYPRPPAEPPGVERREV